MRYLGIIALCLLSAAASATDARYQAFPLPGEAGRNTRAFVIDTQEGHVWIWSENELTTDAGGQRRYASGFTYQGKLRPGIRPGEFIETPKK